ncbi:unnamed protein product [Soboliphyme baturini]|uniref:RRM domain-containing protein n=1 Tax=Soboliphyme baturini TaxID=241478 RepID=A0A183IP46_9BILA|nr:unnamed protein product [Soboliphyme baturini]
MHRRRKRRFYEELLKKAESLFIIKCKDLNTGSDDELTKWRKVEDIAASVQCDGSRISMEIFKKLLLNSRLLEKNENGTLFRRNSNCPPCRACTIYVERLEETMTKQELFKIFSRYGFVVDIFMPEKRLKNGTTTLNKGFAFIQYDNAASVVRACTDVKLEDPDDVKSFIPETTFTGNPTAETERNAIGRTQYPLTTTLRTAGKRRRSPKNRRRRKLLAFQRKQDTTKKFYVISWNEWKRLKREYLKEQANSFRLLKKKLMPYRQMVSRLGIDSSMRGRDKSSACSKYGSEYGVQLNPQSRDRGLVS